MAEQHDLSDAAEERLQVAARAVSKLLRSHEAAMHQRYKILVQEPRVRAVLELKDQATLAFTAKEIANEHGTVFVGFTDEDGQALVAVGDVSERFLSSVMGDRGLLQLGERLAVYVRVPLEIDDTPLGAMLVLEELTATMIQEWSELSGSEIVAATSAGVADRYDLGAWILV